MKKLIHAKRQINFPKQFVHKFNNDLTMDCPKIIKVQSAKIVQIFVQIAHMRLHWQSISIV